MNCQLHVNIGWKIYLSGYVTFYSLHCSKRDVAEGNFVMHEIHCRKNIVLCTKCNEPVPKVSLEEHIEEYHALVNCELCSCHVERSRLEEHKVSHRW